MFLRGAQAFDAGLREREQLVEVGARQRGPFRGRLDFDQSALAGHDHVGVDLGTRVLRVVEVAEGLAENGINELRAIQEEVVGAGG